MGVRDAGQIRLFKAIFDKTNWNEHGFQLKFEMNTEPRKKFHMINRLRKAQKEADKLEKLVMASEQVSARQRLEAYASRQRKFFLSPVRRAYQAREPGVPPVDQRNAVLRATG